MDQHRVVWRTAQPLWSDVGASDEVDEPAVLRFAGDDFMDQFTHALTGDGGGLASLVAGHETWRDAGAGLGTDHEAPFTEPVKLYQPTHGRFYLVTGSLVCRRYGHPDRAVDASADEQVSFVLRRLEPTGSAPVDPRAAGTFAELAWTTAIGDGAWIPVGSQTIVAGEERLPLFPVTTACEKGRRRVHAGLVPVSRREALTSPPRSLTPEEASSPDVLAPLSDERLRQLQPLIAELQHLRAAPDDVPIEVLRESVFYVLADLGRWLQAHLPSAFASGEALGLHLAFRPGMSWRAAMQTAMTGEPEASFSEGSPTPAPVANLAQTTIRSRTSHLLFGRVSSADDGKAPTQTAFFDDVAELLALADAAMTSAAVDATAAAGTPDPAPTTPGGVYAVRFVYERPHCGRAHRVLVSDLSRPVRFAGFHDPDAPGRPIRIALPIDTSPGGLRRFPKNVSVVLSSELRKQMQRVSKDTLHDGTLEDEPEGVSFGMLCQLSIPIITICALILLMIIVQLLNLVFFWVPLFKVCLPIPKGD